jgi:hypothetical protein
MCALDCARRSLIDLPNGTSPFSFFARTWNASRRDNSDLETNDRHSTLFTRWEEAGTVLNAALTDNASAFVFLQAYSGVVDLPDGRSVQVARTG